MVDDGRGNIVVALVRTDDLCANVHIHTSMRAHASLHEAAVGQKGGKGGRENAHARA